MNGLARHWSLDPAVTFLNHGSFGACPIAVQAWQSELRARLESEPVRFFDRELPALLAEARAALAAFVGADADDLAFVNNATAGVNTVLRSLPFGRGDELLTTDHEYSASYNALRFAADRAGATVVVAEVPFPIESPDQVVDAVLARVGPRTRLALLDHVTSRTGLVFPLAQLVAALRDRGVDTLVDGAHAAGQVALDVRAIGAAYYTGNCHKWLCAPKGAAFLVVRRDRQPEVRPLVISHGAHAMRPRGVSLFRAEFDWTGTDDPTAWLCVPEAIGVVGGLVPGGWEEVRGRNRALVLQARDRLCDALGIRPPAPDEMIGSMASLPLARGSGLQDRLLSGHAIEVPVQPWHRPPGWTLRVSAQLYNDASDYGRLADALARELG